MSKIKKPEPLFITFVNLPLISGDYDDWTNDQWRVRIKSVIQERLKKGSLSSKNYTILSSTKQNIEHLDINAFLKTWVQFQDLMGFLTLPILKNEPEYRIESFYRYINAILAKSHPTLNWTVKKGFSFDIDPNASNLIGVLCYELAQFLANDYKPGLFSRCQFDGCEQYIVTSNNRRFCSKYHTQREYAKRVTLDKNKSERSRLRHNIGKQYSRWAHKLPVNHKDYKEHREKFIKKYWPKDKESLYSPPHKKK